MILENTKLSENVDIQLTDAMSKYNYYLGFVSRSIMYDIGNIETWILSNLKLLMRDERYKGIVRDVITGELK